MEAGMSILRLDWRRLMLMPFICILQESGLEIMKMPAAELRDLEANDAARFEHHMLATLHKPYIFKLKVAEETYQDETRVKISVQKWDSDL